MMWVSPPVTHSARGAFPRHDPVVGLALVAEAPGRVAVLAQPHLRRDVGGPHHHDLVLVGEHLVEAGGLVAVLAHERHPLLDDRGEEVELGSRAAP